MPQQRTTCQNNNNTSGTTSTQKPAYTIDTYALHLSKFNLSRDNALFSYNTLSQINSFFGKSNNESFIINPSSSVPVVCDTTPGYCTFNNYRASVGEFLAKSNCKFAKHNRPRRRRCL
ncbi:1022_t:CDS:1, partial [Dentiscutata heterogama]